MEILNSESSIGSGDWDWTMEEFPIRIKTCNSIEASPTKELSEQNLYSTLVLKSTPQITFSKDLEEVIKYQNYYLHYLIYSCQIASISQLLHLSPINLPDIINYQDHHGNSPLFLAVKLCNMSREYLSIVRMLIEHGADIHERDSGGWTMIDEAVNQKNRELVSVLFEYLYIEKLISWENNRKTAQEFLAALPDFYVEIKWEFTSSVIPLVSKIGPHDTCKLWKVGDKMRFDTTLVGWKNFRSKRRNISLVFNEELFVINHSKKIIVNPLEELDHDETNEIINDIMNSEPVQGNLSLLGHNLTQVNNWRGNPKTKLIGKWKANKYKIQFRTHVSITKKVGKSEIKDDYFDNSKGALPKPIFKKKKKITNKKPLKRTHPNIENTKTTLKNSTAYCWLCYDFPLKIEELLSVLGVIRSANKSVNKLYEFLENEGIATLLPENSFPIKLEIPVTMGIMGKVTFMNFAEIYPTDDQNFQIPMYSRVSRRIGQKTLTSPKKRLFFTNIVA